MQDNMGLMIQKMTWGSHGDIEKLCWEYVYLFNIKTSQLMDYYRYYGTAYGEMTSRNEG